MEQNNSRPHQPENNLVTSQLGEISTGNEAYAGASMLKLTESESAKLMAKIPDEHYEIRPDGFIYLPQAFYRKVLNEAFGVGQWALLRREVKTETVSAKLIRVYYDGILMVRGNYVSHSCGESTYNVGNSNQSYATAIEGAKSDAIVRCCKDLGISSEQWQPQFMREWQKKFAVKVWVKERVWNDTTRKHEEKAAVKFRRADVDPFINETGLWSAKLSVAPSDNEGPKAKPVPDEWMVKILACENGKALAKLFNDNSEEIENWPELKTAFKFHQFTLKNKAA